MKTTATMVTTKTLARGESSKRNYYIISPRVIIKAIIIILSDDQNADNIDLRTCSSHGVRQSSSSLTREKSASAESKAPFSQTKPSIRSLTENALRANKTLFIGRRIKIHFPNYGGSLEEVVSYGFDKDL